MVKILVIDDARDLSAEIANLLDFEGYDVVCADGGWQGVEAAKSLAPDLIICDIEMPDLDGYEVFRELHTTRQTELIPFIFLTGQDSREAMRAGMNLGADDYLTKPFEQDDLLNAIHTRLLRAASVDEASNRKAQAEKERLIRRISHELRNPMTGMKLATSLIKQLLGHELPPHMGKVLATYENGVERLQRLTEQMLLQVKLEAQSIDAAYVQSNAEAVPLKKLLDAALILGRSFANEREFIEIHAHMNDENIGLWGVSDLLKQALAEIIGNALDFSDENRPVVIKQWSNAGTVSILIIDEGAGIPYHEQALVLQPYLRASKDQAGRKGLGLGLSLAQQIVSLHGGNFKLVSSEIGTSVLIQIPLALFTDEA